MTCERSNERCSKRGVLTGCREGSVLAVVIPHHEFHFPERYDQILIPKHAERVPESAPPEAARDLFQMALVATRGLM